MTKAELSRPELILRTVSTESGWHAFRLETKKFPLDAARRIQVQTLLEKLTAAFSEIAGVRPTMWIDAQPLHEDGGAKLYSANARAWSPDMGFCFDPSGEAPRPLRLSDLMDVDYGTPPKIQDRSAIHVSALAQTMAAYRLLAGRGISTLLSFAVQDAEDERLAQAVQEFMRHSRDALRPLMAPGCFQNFSFYLPLLSSKSVSGASEQQLANWLGGIEVYLHESFDAREVLILSRKDPSAVFEAAQLRRASGITNEGEWILPLRSDSRTG